MRKIYLALFVTSILSNFIKAQDITRTIDLMKILEQSKKYYNIDYDTINDSIYKRDIYKLPANSNHFYQESINNKIEVKKYEYVDNSNEYMSLATEAWKSGDKVKAREYYKKILAENPKNAQVMTFIGQSYEDLYKPDYKKQKEWYQKAIKTNYLDYMAHWFLADLYFIQGKYKDALKEIKIAYVLNRFNERIKDSFIRISRANKLEYVDWSFKPKYFIKQVHEDTVNIIVGHSDWLTYAICKATWKHEPSYKLIKSSHKINMSMYEELECLQNTVLDVTTKYERTHSDDETIKYIIRAFEQKKIFDFIIFEIWGPQNPILILSLKKEILEDLVKYVDEFHLKSAR